MTSHTMPDGDGATEPSATSNLGFVMLLTIFAGIGGFLFGYDTGVVSGAILLIQEEFDLSDTMQEIVISSAVAGAILGSCFAGVLNGIMGRKWTVVWSSSLFCIGAVLMGIALDVYTLIFGRLVIGVAIGVASMTVPVYIAEVAPESIRGSLVSFDVLLITAGQFGAYVIDAIFIHVPGTWRWMLGLGAVPALVQGIGMFFLPESPRILVSNGDSNAALNLLIRTRSSVDVARRELSEIEQECREEAEAFGTRSVLSIIRSDAGLMRAVAIGVGLQIFQQICGINTVMYYSATILKMAGFANNDDAIYWSMAIAFTNMSMSIVAVVLIDRVGRRPLLLISLAGSGAALFLLAVSFAFDSGFSHWLALVALVLYLVFFAPGMGPAPWAINAEIYPLFMRSTGTSLATCANWSANFVVSLTFLSLTNLITETGTFVLYGCICIVALVCVFLFVPETKGRSLENIKDLFLGSVFVYNAPPPPLKQTVASYA